MKDYGLWTTTTIPPFAPELLEDETLFDDKEKDSDEESLSPECQEGIFTHNRINDEDELEDVQKIYEKKKNILIEEDELI